METQFPCVELTRRSKMCFRNRTGAVQWSVHIREPLSSNGRFISYVLVLTAFREPCIRDFRKTNTPVHQRSFKASTVRNLLYEHVHPNQAKCFRALCLGRLSFYYEDKASQGKFQKNKAKLVPLSFSLPSSIKKKVRRLKKTPSRKWQNLWFQNWPPI